MNGVGRMIDYTLKADGLPAVFVAWWGTRIGRLLPMCAGVLGITVCSGSF